MAVEASIAGIRAMKIPAEDPVILPEGFWAGKPRMGCFWSTNAVMVPCLDPSGTTAAIAADVNPKMASGCHFASTS